MNFPAIFLRTAPSNSYDMCIIINIIHSYTQYRESICLFVVNCGQIRLKGPQREFYSSFGNL